MNAFVLIHFGDKTKYLELEILFCINLRKYTDHDIIYCFITSNFLFPFSGTGHGFF